MQSYPVPVSFPVRSSGLFYLVTEGLEQRPWHGGECECTSALPQPHWADFVSLTTNLREATFQGDLFGPTVSEDFVHRCGEQMSGWRSIFAMEALRASHIVNRPGSSEPHQDLLSCTLVD